MGTNEYTVESGWPPYKFDTVNDLLKERGNKKIKRIFHRLQRLRPRIQGDHLQDSSKGSSRTPGGLATGDTIAGVCAPDVADGEPYRCCGGG